MGTTRKSKGLTHPQFLSLQEWPQSTLLDLPRALALVPDLQTSSMLREEWLLERAVPTQLDQDLKQDAGGEESNRRKMTAVISAMRATTRSIVPRGDQYWLVYLTAIADMCKGCAANQVRKDAGEGEGWILASKQSKPRQRAPYDFSFTSIWRRQVYERFRRSGEAARQERHSYK